MHRQPFSVQLFSLPGGNRQQIMSLSYGDFWWRPVRVGHLWGFQPWQSPRASGEGASEGEKDQSGLWTSSWACALRAVPSPVLMQLSRFRFRPNTVWFCWCTQTDLVLLSFKAFIHSHRVWGAAVTHSPELDDSWLFMICGLAFVFVELTFLFLLLFLVFLGRINVLCCTLFSVSIFTF